MIIIYRKIPKEDMLKEVPHAIRQTNKFLKEHPERHKANVGLWYGRTFPIRRGHVKEDILKAVDLCVGKDEASTHIMKSVSELPIPRNKKNAKKAVKAVKA